MIRGKVFLISGVLLVLLLAQFCSAAPSMYGPKGLFRVITADPEDMGSFSMNLHIFATQPSVDTGYVTSDTVDTFPAGAIDGYGQATILVNMSYAILDVWSLYYGGQFTGDAVETENIGQRSRYPIGPYMGYDNRRSIGLGDMQVGTKLTWPLLSSESGTKVLLGLDAFVSFPTGTKRDTVLTQSGGDILENQGGVFRFFSSNGYDGGGRLLFTFRSPGETPVLFHTNVGYIYRTLVPEMKANQLTAGFGTEVQIGYITPFIEVTTEQWIHDSEEIYGNPPIRISPGIRFSTPVGLAIDLGGDFRVSSENTTPIDEESYVTTGVGTCPPWAVHLGISNVYDFIVPPKAPETGIIAGKIYDEKTDNPLGATVSFPSDTAIQSTTSNPSTGLYKITIPEGSYRIRISKKGYKSKDIPVQVVPKKTALLDVALVRLVVAKGHVTGKVTDASTGRAIGANLSFPGTQLPGMASDLSTGIYKATVPPGTYTLEVVADGYIPQALPVVVEKDRTFMQNFELLKKGGKITLTGITFDTGKATIKAISYPILDRAVDLLKKNPRVRVEIQGHTDSVGSDAYNMRLSQARANSVHKYLVEHGIDPARLTARGYGETSPIADNRTRDGRAQNRRIDFKILSQ